MERSISQSNKSCKGSSQWVQLLLNVPLKTLQDFLVLERSHDLIVTGCSRPAIPESISQELRQKIPGAIFTSNPCRLQYCTREIVVFREDIVMKMCRNCVRFPSDGEIPNHVSTERGEGGRWGVFPCACRCSDTCLVHAALEDDV